MDPNSQTAAAAGTIGLILMVGYLAIGIISLVCWIKVLIALFKKEGAGLGILGILCSIFAFIWGWMKSTELGLKKTMIWWTLSIVGAFVLAALGGLGMAGAVANNPEFQKEFQKQMEEAQRKAQEQQNAPTPAPAPAPAPQ